MVFQGGFMVFHGFWLVSMVFQGGFMVYHGFWLVPMVLLVENTTKLYPGPTIQSRPCRPVSTPIIPRICQIISTTEISDRANFSYALHKKFTS